MKNSTRLRTVLEEVNRLENQISIMIYHYSEYDISVYGKLRVIRESVETLRKRASQYNRWCNKHSSAILAAKKVEYLEKMDCGPLLNGLQDYDFGSTSLCHVQRFRVGGYGDIEWIDCG